MHETIGANIILIKYHGSDTDILHWYSHESVARNINGLVESPFKFSWPESSAVWLI